MSGLVLLVGGDVAQRTARSYLEQAGFAVRSSSNRTVLEDAQKIPPCLIVIDSAQPSAPSLELCKHIRHNSVLSRIPVVLLTSDEETRIQGLESGADDCVAYPFGSRELLARVQSVLRRSPRLFQSRDPESTDIVIDRAAMRLSVRGSEVTTTSLEFRLLDYLALHPGRVFTRDVLLDAVWGEMQFVTPRSVDACIRRVRHKIEPDRTRPTYLKTVRGVGYRFDAVAAWLQD